MEPISINETQVAENLATKLAAAHLQIARLETALTTLQQQKEEEGDQ